MQIIKKFITVMCAGITSLIILCGIFSFYDLMPVHITSKLGNTDYVWPEHSVWIKMTEGMSWGKFDSQGFNNLNTIENPDILILGSSHMEATNVMQDENVGYLLNNKFKNRYSVYNMGISGHSFSKVLQYLPKTLELFRKEPEFIVIETSSIKLDKKIVNDIFSNNIEFTPSYDKGIIAKLQKLPFFRLMYHQLKNGMIDLLFPSQRKVVCEKKVSVSTVNLNDDVQQYDRIFSYLVDLEKKYNTEFIVFYHPSETLKEDGSVIFSQDRDLETFKNKCKEYNINFLDMTQPFYEMYSLEHKLPHGFITGEIGTGHINANGHHIIAEELYKLINKEKVR